MSEDQKNAASLGGATSVVASNDDTEEATANNGKAGKASVHFEHASSVVEAKVGPSTDRDATQVETEEGTEVGNNVEIDTAEGQVEATNNDAPNTEEEASMLQTKDGKDTAQDPDESQAAKNAEVTIDLTSPYWQSRLQAAKKQLRQYRDWYPSRSVRGEVATQHVKREWESRLPIFGTAEVSFTDKKGTLSAADQEFSKIYNRVLKAKVRAKVLKDARSEIKELSEQLETQETQLKELAKSCTTYESLAKEFRELLEAVRAGEEAKTKTLRTIPDFKGIGDDADATSSDDSEEGTADKSSGETSDAEEDPDENHKGATTKHKRKKGKK